VRITEPCAAAIPAIALWLQSVRLVAAVAELGAVGGMTIEWKHHENIHLCCAGSRRV
jgi:hypothetical protein